MVTYSHSRIQTFLQCKQKYKFKYIDRVSVDIPTTIELFMGDIIHQTLYELYKRVSLNKQPKLSDMLSFFYQRWDQKWSDDILIVKQNKEYYKQAGLKIIQDFYKKHYPFTQYEILGLETSDTIQIDEKNKYWIKIDKLTKDDKGNYYICDYKTNNKDKTETELKDDTQLAMYALWVREKFGNQKPIKLCWSFVKSGNEITVEATHIDETKEYVKKVIADIEYCANYTPTPSRLCDWCVYKSMCPAWNNVKQEVQSKLFEF